VWVYVAAAEAAYVDEVRRVRFIYLEPGVDVVWEPERDDVMELRRRLVLTVREIDACEVFEAVPGAQCNWCQFALRCVERTQVSLDELVPVEGLPFDLEGLA
jgi:hypothetical protein